MNRRGVCYDVGTVYRGAAWRISTRPRFGPAVARRELEIIRDELHCNAVRITGQDVTRLAAAAEAALELGLEVWLSPTLHEKSQDQTLAHFLAAAHAAEELRVRFTAPARTAPAAAALAGASAASTPAGTAPAAGSLCHSGDDGGAACQNCPLAGACQPPASPVVFCLGGELSLFMRGIVPGRSVPARLASLVREVQAGETGHTERLNAFLGRANTAVREVFGGPVSYASLAGESVDWRPFDFVGIDHYRDARIRDHYADMLRPFFGTGKPVVVTETGMRGYRGAADSGTLGSGVIDNRSLLLHHLPLAGRLVKARLAGTFVRDEALQARELTDILGQLHAAGVDGVFVSSFVEPLAPFSEDPRHDLDMSALSLVKSLPGGEGATYPGMPWEPKEAFRAVAGCYAGPADGI